jgi:hypothetical protein
VIDAWAREGFQGFVSRVSADSIAPPMHPPDVPRESVDKPREKENRSCPAPREFPVSTKSA